MNPYFKESFIEHYKGLTDIDVFLDYSSRLPRKSFRVNTLKIKVNDALKRLDSYSLQAIPWCKEGFYLEGRTDLGNLFEHTLGYIYIQSSVSMVPAVVLKPKAGDLVLDVAASPGSKTTQMAALMDNKGLILANDITTDRIKILSMNLQRCGIINTIITQRQGHLFKDLTMDKVLLDAPCSGTGIIRKSPKTPKEWSLGLIKHLSRVQKKLILAGFDYLKEGGRMVYSTCSMEPEEDEGVVSYLLEQRQNVKIEKISLPLQRSPCFTEFEKSTYSPEVKKCLRIWPQDNDSDGFFVASIKKT